MHKKDYIYLNRTIVVVGVILLFVFIELIDSGSIKCVHLTITGSECGSCGVSRDFLSFLKLDFDTPINENSLALFNFIVFQFIYRIVISGLNIGEDVHQILSNKGSIRSESMFNKLRRSVSMKKIIIADVLIILFYGVSVFVPFWI